MQPIPAIYLVEDDPAVAESIVAICAAENWPTETFVSAEEFIQGDIRNRFGCVIIDLRLPGLSGLEFQAWLGRTLPALPVILISGFADVDSAVTGMRGGAITLLQKPFEPHQLVRAIHEAMAKIHQTQSQQEMHRHFERLIAALTRSELETVELIVSGKSNKQIAAIQGLSVRGIEDRRSRLMKHFGTRSLAEFVSTVQSALPRPH